LPVGLALWRPKRAHIPNGTADPERRSRPCLARAIVDPDRGPLPRPGRARRRRRRLRVGGLARPARARDDDLPRAQGRRAVCARAAPDRRPRPAEKRERRPTIAQIAADGAAGWTQTTATRHAKTAPLQLRDLPCRRYEALNDSRCRPILVADPDDPARAQLAFLATDRSPPPAQIIERYADRWSIEVCFQDARHVFGVGHAGNRVQLAVERTAPFGFLTMTLTILWYAQHGHHPEVVAEHRARAPCDLSKANPSVADVLAKLRRTIIAAQYQPRHAAAPTPQQITAVQQAWAAAAA
jgi:hypothetical protein